jgi:hypothetical protein
MAVAMLSASSARGDLTALVPAFLTFGVVWIVSAWWMRREAKRISTVCRRGFLLGAAEWVAMIPVGAVMTAEHAPNSSTAVGIVGIITGGLSIAMAFGCLVCFAVAFLMGRKTESSGRQKPARCARRRSKPRLESAVSVALI